MIKTKLKFILLLIISVFLSPSSSLSSLPLNHKQHSLSLRKISRLFLSPSSSSSSYHNNEKLILNSVKLDSSLSDAEKEAKLVPLYGAAKIAAIGLVAIEIPKLINKINVSQSLLVIYTYIIAAIACATLESAALRTRLSGTTFKTLNIALTTSVKFSLVMASLAIWKYPITTAMKTNYWFIIIQALLTISPCMKALKLHNRSLVKSPRISIIENSILGVGYLATSIHYFIQNFKILFLTKTTFPITYHSFGLFLVPAALLTLHDAANTDYKRLSSDTYKRLNLLVLIYAGTKFLIEYKTSGFNTSINFIADLCATLFGLIGLIIGFIVKKK